MANIDGRTLHAENVLDFIALPSSLTRLVLNAINVDSSQPKIASLLPRSLRRLETSIFVKQVPLDIVMADWADAPPHLEHVSYLELYTTLKSLHWLPPSLVGSQVIAHLATRLCPSLTDSLPSHMEYLKINYVERALYNSLGQNWVAQLPSKLQQLCFAMQEELAPGESWYQIISQLPPSLERLVFYEHSKFNWAEFLLMPSPWPVALSTLQLTHGTILPDCIQLLPKTLTYLYFQVEASGPYETAEIDGNHFPPKLRSLYLKEEAIISIQNTLPLSLTSISFLNLESLRGGIDSQTLLGVGKLEHVKSLEARLAFCVADCSLDLPPNLSRLVVSHWDANQFSVIPRAVTHLKVGLLSNASTGFCSLPPHLDSLTIKETDESNVDFLPNLFPSLPRLRCLKVHKAGRFASSTLRVLPSQLKKLEMTFSSINEIDAPFIPPHLKRWFIQIYDGNYSPTAEYWPLGGYNVPKAIAERVNERIAELQKLIRWFPPDA